MKAQGLSMSILVVAAIAVMVLLLLGVFFTGGFRRIGTGMMDFVQGTTDEESASIAECNTFCTKKDAYTTAYGASATYPVGAPTGCECP